MNILNAFVLEILSEFPAQWLSPRQNEQRRKVHFPLGAGMATSLVALVLTMVVPLRVWLNGTADPIRPPVLKGPLLMPKSLARTGPPIATGLVRRHRTIPMLPVVRAVKVEKRSNGTSPTPRPTHYAHPERSPVGGVNYTELAIAPYCVDSEERGQYVR